MATIGLNIAGGEFGGTGGIHDQNYHYPTLSELQFYKSKGVDLIRLPFSWERVQEAMGGPLDVNGDLALIKQVLVNAASLGMDVILDNHNYGRYYGVAIGAPGGPTAAQFADFWKKMAVELKDYPALLGYDLMNEPHDMPTAGTWKAAAQAAVNAIRTVDMNNNIYIEGDDWSGAHSWLRVNADLIIQDPANRIIYQAHQYFDDNNSGTYDQSYDGEGAYPMVGVDRLKPFVEWLNANGLKGMIGEFGVPSNDARWLDVQKNVLEYMKANNLDGTAWAGGAWWPSDYPMYTASPGRPDSPFMDLLEQYFSEYKDVFATAAPAPVAPSVAVGDVAGLEANGEIVFTITRSGDLSKGSVVNYSTADGTAVAGLDYTTTSGSVTFVAGQATATVKVVLINDTLVETPETLTLNLSGGSNATIVDGQGVGTITSDDVAAPAPAPSSPGTVTGTAGNDSLNGTSGSDTIDGQGGNDVLDGRGGADRLTGGAGSDRFIFNSPAEANGDVVTDFVSGVDKLDVSGIDANAFRSGNQNFTWLDNAMFTGLTGQLREYDKDGKHYVEGDTNGDRVADFTIEVGGAKDLTAADFLGLVTKTSSGNNKNWGSMVAFVDDSASVTTKGSVQTAFASDVPTRNVLDNGTIARTSNPVSDKLHFGSLEELSGRLSDNGWSDFVGLGGRAAAQPAPQAEEPVRHFAVQGALDAVPDHFFEAGYAPHHFSSGNYFL